MLQGVLPGNRQGLDVYKRQGVWGMRGMLLGVPIMAVIYALVAQFVGKRLRKKGISASELAQHEHVMEQPMQDGQETDV